MHKTVHGKRWVPILISVLLTAVPLHADGRYEPELLYSGVEIQQVVMTRDGFLQVGDRAFVLEKNGTVLQVSLEGGMKSTRTVAPPGSFEQLAWDGQFLHGLKSGKIQRMTEPGFWADLELGGWFARNVRGIWGHEWTHTSGAPEKRLYYQTTRGVLYSRAGKETRKLGSFPAVERFSTTDGKAAFSLGQGRILFVQLSLSLEYDTLRGPVAFPATIVDLHTTPLRVHVVDPEGAVHLFQTGTGEDFYRTFSRKLTFGADFGVIAISPASSLGSGTHMLGRDGSIWTTLHDDDAWSQGNDPARWKEQHRDAKIEGAHILQQVPDLDRPCTLVAAGGKLYLLVSPEHRRSRRAFERLHGN